MAYQRARPGVLRFSVTYFLCALVLMMVITPFLEDLRNGDIIEALCFSLVLIAGVMAIGHNHHTRIVGLALAIPSIVTKWLNHLWPDHVSPVIYLTLGFLFVIYLSAQLFRFIARAPMVDSEVLCAAVANYIMIGLIWAFMYIIAEAVNSHAFFYQDTPGLKHAMRGVTAVYFSFITLTTVGYGDIVPLGGGVRMLVITEAIAGVFYMALLISRLISLYSAKTPAPENTTKQTHTH